MRTEACLTERCPCTDPLRSMRFPSKRTCFAASRHKTARYEVDHDPTTTRIPGQGIQLQRGSQQK